jgi:hypothetical protein
MATTSGWSVLAGSLSIAGETLTYTFPLQPSMVVGTAYTFRVTYSGASSTNELDATPIAPPGGGGVFLT